MKNIKFGEKWIFGQKSKFSELFLVSVDIYILARLVVNESLNYSYFRYFPDQSLTSN